MSTRKPRPCKMTHAARHLRRLALVEDARRGMTDAELVAKHGLKLRGVQEYRRRGGVKATRKRKIDPRTQEYAALHGQGMSFRAIGGQVGLSGQRVFSIVKKGRAQ